MNTMPHSRAFTPAQPIAAAFVAVVYWVIDGELHESVRLPLRGRTWTAAKREHHRISDDWRARFPNDDLRVLVRRSDYPVLKSGADDRVSVDTREWLQSG